MFSDKIKIIDDLKIVGQNAKSKVRRTLLEWLDPHAVVISVEGWVEVVMRERGKIVPGSRRRGKNVWSNTGREYITQVISIQTMSPRTPIRSDLMAYIGVGTGAQPEDVSVTALVTPIAYTGAVFLAPLNFPPTFPLNPSRTTVRYTRTFAENEITTSPSSSVNISELGLFTDGDPTLGFALRSAGSLNLSVAAQQLPFAYKAIEPVQKTDALELEVNWELRL